MGLAVGICGEVRAAASQEDAKSCGYAVESGKWEGVKVGRDKIVDPCSYTI